MHTLCNVSLNELKHWVVHLENASSSYPVSPASLSSLSSKKGGESLVASAGKVVDFQRLALVVPIRLQNKSMCTRPLSKKLSTRKCQMNELISVDYTSKGGEKQFLDVRKGRKSRESKNKVRCSWPTHSPYIDWSSSEFTCTKCIPELNRAEDALKTGSKT